MTPNRRLGTILGALGVGTLSLNFLISHNHAVRYPDGLKVLGVALVIVTIPAVAWLAWTFHKARTFKERQQADHPGALVVDTFWTSKELGRFLKKGPTTKKAKGAGFILDLIADASGLQLVRQRRNPVYFGLVPWEKVISVRMETLRRPLERRPLLVLEIESFDTPYVAIIRLVPSGRQNKESGMELADMILAQRPHPHLTEMA